MIELSTQIHGTCDLLAVGIVLADQIAVGSGHVEITLH